MYNYTGTDLPPPPAGGDGGEGAANGVMAIATDLPSPWAYVGCFVDGATGRVLTTEMIDDNLTMESCVATCDAQNFTIAGGEFSTQCFCGNELIEGATPAAESNCNMACGGNSTYVDDFFDIPKLTKQKQTVKRHCGAGGRLSLYSTTSNITILPVPVVQNSSIPGSWSYQGCLAEPNGARVFGREIDNMNNNSASACLGRFPMLVSVPLLATLGINNKVTLLDKQPADTDNSTGAYELDLTLASNFSAAWREMHVKSNVFCSGSITLPDKGGRQLNVGGWTLESTQGVRLYMPDGSPGVNGTNDWEENFKELHLQRQRWYPTAAMLPNGTIMVIGGKISVNGAAESNVEILPTPEGGDTVIFLEWLNRTNPNNLYPFVFVLPSGNIFVVYYNEARIIDAATFDTIQILPNLPGSVSDFSAGRTYPLEGAAVMFPQHAPYIDPLEVLLPIYLTRVYECDMDIGANVGLPDGTFLILNGAVQGTAGFGLATDPNLRALLYDPTMPFNQRISILSTTIVARLYHSERPNVDKAILLPDGRVLVSGSDPLTPVNPEEHRIEVYIPPYLAQGFTQPSFNLTDTDWAYGSNHKIEVTLHHGTPSTMKVSLIAATSSTHGNSMGSRTLFPPFSCIRNTCTITAPPNAFVSPPGWHQLFILDGPTPSHSAWVRIGGDPAGLGNWPNLPGFTLPGV
ncbi:glyoxal oxidase N-terminus-domain-containing protein [Mycena vulgaris]|nr:glyoxal oxidase N-terminus-domain-containing protein [Mycena vulgaris]